MKKLIFVITFLISSHLFAETATPEKTIVLKNHVVKMHMQGNKLYRLELRESAAVYQAEEKFSPCLQKSIKENKTADLTVTAFTLKVVDCKNN